MCACVYFYASWKSGQLAGASEVILFRTLSLREEIPAPRKNSVSRIAGVVSDRCASELGYDLETRFQARCIYRLTIALMAELFVAGRCAFARVSGISMPTNGLTNFFSRTAMDAGKFERHARRKYSIFCFFFFSSSSSAYCFYLIKVDTFHCF